MSTRRPDPDLQHPRPGKNMHPEAIAMRRIVVEMGFWLSPLLRDHPIPVLTEYERTVDLQKIVRNHGSAGKLPPAPPEPPRPKPIQNGDGRASVYKPLTMEDLREEELRRNAARAAARAEKAARGREIAELIRAAAPPKPQPPPRSEAALAREAERLRIRNLSPEEKLERRREQNRARCKRAREKLGPEKLHNRQKQERDRLRSQKRRDSKRTPEEIAERARIRNLTPEEKEERRREKRRQYAAKWYAKHSATPESRKELMETKARQKREREAKDRAGIERERRQSPSLPAMPTARQLRDEAIHAAAIEAMNNRSR